MLYTVLCCNSMLLYCHYISGIKLSENDNNVIVIISRTNLSSNKSSLLQVYCCLTVFVSQVTILRFW